MVYGDDLLSKINGLKQKLSCLVNKKGRNLSDHEVVQISQQLDIYILELQKEHIKGSR
ncbi:aspartyl-phosphate phosphatase Spo0E family protein [Paenibacillus sp. MER 180]|uniref:aspartyl-phosphate phosphatase Spo0E family protein n=1 Tax=Paenibacillus sp. MER 180 TaxID=2939570 RepID=UPI0009F1F2F4|nr:aspartyl-phosphate phosphatase Spo0E family protein [Paenibacillus sp. MER 180]